MKKTAKKKSGKKRVSAALKKFLQQNPATSQIKGRKVNGGRAFNVKNFTGTIIKKGDAVLIEGLGKK